MRNSQIVVNIRVVLLQLSRFAILAYGLAVLSQPCIGLRQIVMCLRIVAITFEVLLVSRDRLLILRFGLFSLAQRFITESEPEVALREIRIKFDCFLKRLDRFIVLVVPVEFLSFFQLVAGPGAIPGEIVGHFGRSRTIIRALLTAALTTRGKYQKPNPAD